MSTQTTVQGRIELYSMKVYYRRTSKIRDPLEFCTSTLPFSIALVAKQGLWQHLTYGSSIAQLLHSSLYVFFPEFIIQKKKKERKKPWLYCGDGGTGQITTECGCHMIDWCCPLSPVSTIHVCLLCAHWCWSFGGVRGGLCGLTWQKGLPGVGLNMNQPYEWKNPTNPVKATDSPRNVFDTKKHNVLPYK